MFSTDIFQYKRSNLETKNISKQVNWSKYNTLSPKKYYFLETVKSLSVSLLLGNILT